MGWKADIDLARRYFAARLLTVALIRILTISTLAALAACVTASLIVDGSVDRWSLAPLIFTLLGSVFLIAPGYGALKEQGMPLAGRYLLLLLLGTIAGAVMLGFISVGNPDGILMGALYGAITALCWIGLHFFSKVALASGR